MTPEAEQRHNDLNDTVMKLSNGHRGDPLVMSDGIVNISRTLQVILASNYITHEQCSFSHEAMKDDIKAAKFGWKGLAAVLVGCATAFSLGVKLIDTIWSTNNESVAYIADFFNYFV